MFFPIAFLLLTVTGMAEPPMPGVQAHIGLMVSDDHYHADTLLPPFVEKLAEENGWRLTILHGKGTSDFPDFDVLDSIDSLVIFVRRLPLPEKQLKKLKEWIASGKGIVGMRTASHAFTLRNKEAPVGYANWPGFDKEILGGNYDDHGRDELGTDVENIVIQAESPIIQGVVPAKWHSIGSLYFTGPVASDATVYQVGHSTEKQNVPLTWTRTYKKSRIAYTALGHPEDYKEPAFRKLLENLIRWTLVKELPSHE